MINDTPNHGRARSYSTPAQHMGRWDARSYDSLSFRVAGERGLPLQQGPLPKHQQNELPTGRSQRPGAKPAEHAAHASRNFQTLYDRN